MPYLPGTNPFQQRFQSKPTGVMGGKTPTDCFTCGPRARQCLCMIQ